MCSGWPLVSPADRKLFSAAAASRQLGWSGVLPKPACSHQPRTRTSCQKMLFSSILVLLTLPELLRLALHKQLLLLLMELYKWKEYFQVQRIAARLLTRLPFLRLGLETVQKHYSGLWRGHIRWRDHHPSRGLVSQYIYLFKLQSISPRPGVPQLTQGHSRW